MLQKAMVVHHKLIFEKKVAIDLLAIHEVVHAKNTRVDKANFPTSFFFFQKMRFGGYFFRAQKRFKELTIGLAQKRLLLEIGFKLGKWTHDYL
jgi:hypothetical protein